MRHALSACASTLVLASMISVASAQPAPAHVMVKPEELKWADVPSLPKGAKIAVIEGPLSDAAPFTFRIKLPANFQVPPHSHNGIEHVTVLSGTFNLGMGDKLDKSKTMALKAGSIAIMQPKTNHFAWTKDETIVQVHGTGPFHIYWRTGSEWPCP